MPIARMFAKVMGAGSVIRSYNRIRSTRLGSPITHNSCSPVKPVTACAVRKTIDFDRVTTPFDIIRTSIISRITFVTHDPFDITSG